MTASNSPRIARRKIVSPGNGPAMSIPHVRASRDGGLEHVGLFAPENAVLAGVRIQPREREPWMRDAESRQLAVGQLDDPAHRFNRQRRRHARERDVNGREHDAQLLRPEHHRDARRLCELGEHLGVSPPRQARQSQRLLVDRCRRNRVNAPALRIAYGAHNRFVRREAGIRGQDARGEWVLGSVKEGLAHFKDARIGHGLPRYFGSDTCWVAGCDADSG